MLVALVLRFEVGGASFCNFLASGVSRAACPNAFSEARTEAVSGFTKSIAF